MKTFLVPTDFSQAAESAVHLAVDLAKKQRAHIKLLTMLDFPKLKFRVIESANYTKEEYYALLREDAEREIERWINWYPDVAITGVIKDENEGLTPVILSEEADLIVMGSEGQDGWGDYFMGTNSQQVVRKSSSPVLVVKNDASSVQLDRILIVSDFKDTSFFEKVAAVLDLSNTFCYFLYVDTGDDYDGKGMHDQAKALASEHDLRLFEFNIQKASTVKKGVLDFATRVDAGMVVMRTNGREGLERLFMGSIAEEIVNASSLPTLTIVS